MFIPSLRFQLLGLLLLIVVPIIGLMAFHARTDYQANRDHARAEVGQMADEIVREQGHVIDLSRQLLLELSRQPVILDQNLAGCTTLFTTLNQQYPKYIGFALQDPEGNQLCTSGTITQLLAAADVPVFQRASETEIFAADDFEVTPLTRHAAIIVSYPVLDKHNQMESVLLVALSLDWLSRQLAMMSETSGIELSIIDQNGIFVAHGSDPAQFNGKTVENKTIFAAVTSRPAVPVAVTDTGQPSHFLVLAPLSQDLGEAYLLASMPRTVLDANINTRLLNSLGILLLVASIATFLVLLSSHYFVRAAIKRLVTVTQRLADGDRNARTGLQHGRGELGHLAAVIDHLAEVLQHSENEALRVAEERYQAAVEHAALQEQIVQAQQSTLWQLSTPLIPFAEGVVIMPLIGTIDSRRAQQILATLLAGVSAHRANIAIIDITGVQIVDAQVAGALLEAAKTVKVLGAEVILTGIQPAIAQALVHLSVDLGDIVAYSSLQDGVINVLERSGS